VSVFPALFTGGAKSLGRTASSLLRHAHTCLRICMSESAPAPRWGSAPLVCLGTGRQRWSLRFRRATRERVSALWGEGTMWCFLRWEDECQKPLSAHALGFLPCRGCLSLPLVLEEPLGWRTALDRSSQELEASRGSARRSCSTSSLSHSSPSLCPCSWELGEAQADAAAGEQQQPGQLFCQGLATGVELSISAECCEPAWGAVSSGVARAPALRGSHAACLPLVNELSPCP